MCNPDSGRSQKLEAMSSIWSLWPIGLIFFHAVSSSIICYTNIIITDLNSTSESNSTCYKNITDLNSTSESNSTCYKNITDLNSTSESNSTCYKNITGLNSNSECKFAFMGNLCLMPLLKENYTTGYCSSGTSKYTFNVMNEKTYEVILYENVEGVNLWFILKACIMKLSLGSTGSLDFINTTVHDLCNETPSYNSTGCTGSLDFINTTLQDMYNNNSSNNLTGCTGIRKYVLNVKQYLDETDEFTLEIPAGPDGSVNVSMAVNTMENLTSIVKSMGQASTAKITMGKSTGLIKIQKQNQDLRVGYSSSGKMQVIAKETKEEFPWSVVLPQEAFDVAQSDKNKKSFVGVLQFPNLTKGVLNNVVYGISMGSHIANLTNTINIDFRDVNVSEATLACHSWDGKGSNPNWTTSGCETNRTNNTIECRCTHLTFFAILMSLPEKNQTGQYLTSLTYITYIGCGLSTFFLCIGLFMHYVTRGAQSRPATTILMNLFVAVVLLNITFLSNQQIASMGSNISCIVIAAVMHFSMLATFTWYFMQGLHLYMMLIMVNTSTRNYKVAVTASGWGFPAMVVVIIASLGMYQPLTIVQMCWIQNIYVHYIVNIGYYALVCIFTLAIFIVIVGRIIQTRIKETGSVATTKKLSAILSLFVLLGLTWGVSFFAYGDMVIPSYFIFTILNSFQGFFLFLYYYFSKNDEMNQMQPTISTTAEVDTTGFDTTI